jgi:type III secretion system HrpE/YscL family protein
MTDRPAPVFVPKRKVVSLLDMRSVSEAGTLLAEARKISAKAQQDVAIALEAGRSHGYETGYAEGRRAALEDFAGAVSRARDLLAASDHELTDILIAALENIVGQIGETELTRRCVIRALEDAAGDVWACVRTSPEDLAQISADIQAAPMTAAWPEIKSVEADPLLKPGEVVLETPKGRCHVGMRQQIARLQAALSEGRS